MSFKSYLTEAKRVPSFEKIVQDYVKDNKSVRNINRHFTKSWVDVAFYSKKPTINNQTNQRGTIYEHVPTGTFFTTEFTTDGKKLTIFYLDNDYKVSINKKITTKKVIDILKTVGATIPRTLGTVYMTGEKNIVPLSSIINTRRDGNKFIIDFKDNNNDTIEFPKSVRSAKITGKEIVSQYQRSNYKKADVNKIIKGLENLFPEYFKIKDPNTFHTVDELNKYLENNLFFGFQDTGGITGEGMSFSKKVGKDSITLETQAGYQYYGEWTKFNIELKLPISRKLVDQRVKSFKKYHDEMSGRFSNYGKGLAAWVKDTGGHHGNPVWMD